MKKVSEIKSEIRKHNKQISLHKAIIKNEEKEIGKHNKEITRLKDELMRLETEQITFL